MQQLLTPVPVVCPCIFPQLPSNNHSSSFSSLNLAWVFLIGRCYPWIIWGKGILGNVVPDFCPVMQNRLQKSVLMMQMLQYTSQANINKYVLISLPLLHTRGLGCCVLYPPTDLFWRSFSVGCAFIVLLAIVSLPFTEVISIYISTHSVSLSIVLHPG